MKPPPTEEEAAMMMSMMEELMKPPTEEEMAQMEQAWMDWEAQMEEEWKANGGLMGMMGMTGEDMQMMMEMKAHCQCTSSSVAFGQMAMPSMPTAAGRRNKQGTRGHHYPDYWKMVPSLKKFAGKSE